MSAGQQTHFLGQLNRTVTLASGRPEPEIWFRELRILDKLSLGAERRRITLHRGFNILWAAPEDPDIEQGLYRDGLAGHASGKTLFCRILRHLLGEEPFGTQSQRDGIANHFATLWAVASVRVRGKSWIVGRPLATAGEDFALPLDSFTEAFKGSEIPAGGYGAFLTEVKALGQCVEPLYPEQGWRHLLPWLARDQEARFSSLVAWRETASQGDNPLTKVIDRHQVMRAVLGLLDHREPALRQQIEKNEATLENLRAAHTTGETELAGKVVLANEQAEELLGSEMPEDIEHLTARLNALAEVIRDGVDGLSKRPPPPAVIEAQRRLATTNKALTLTESELKTVNDELPEQKRRRDRDLTTIRQIRTGNVIDPTRAESGFCPRTLQASIERECYQVSSPTKESALSVAELERQAQVETDLITAREGRAAKLSKELPKLGGEVRDAEKNLADAQRDANRDLAILTRKATRAEEVSKLYANIEKTKKAQETAGKNVDKQAVALEKDRVTLTQLRREMDEKVDELSNIFADIVRGVMGASVEPSVAVTGDGIIPHVTRKSELSGAALDTIKTLAFDLAALVASIEGKGNHPRFLIHDGPREGDMARIIYERFFIYAVGIEVAFPTPYEASFQYIVTTTTPPPKNMRQGSRWLLDPVLDSRRKDARLLKEDF